MKYTVVCPQNSDAIKRKKAGDSPGDRQKNTLSSKSYLNKKCPVKGLLIGHNDIGTIDGIVPDTYQRELVVNLHQVRYLVLLQHYKVIQVSAPPTGTVLTVHHVRFPAVALSGYKQQVKHLHLGTRSRQKECRSVKKKKKR